VFESTAIMREMYRIVLGEGIGELELARRLMVLFGAEPKGGVPVMLEDSLFELGERAKLGMRKTSMGLVRCGMLRPGLCVGMSFLSELDPFAFVGVAGVLASLTLTPSYTSCMLPAPYPLSLLSSRLKRPQMGRSGLPCFRISYHIHWPTRAQSTKT
jgi:hypothetical protein